MTHIAESMRAVVAALVDDDRLKGRHITTDPRNLQYPGVLVEPPRLDKTAVTMCGEVRGTLSVFVVGVPGAWAEFKAMAELADLVFAVLDDSERLDWTAADFVSFQLPNEVNVRADPAMAYQITVEVFV